MTPEEPPIKNESKESLADTIVWEVVSRYARLTCIQNTEGIFVKKKKALD